MSIASKVIGLLGGVFNLFARSGGGIIVRQPGGTAGTDEARISHDGTSFVIDNVNPGPVVVKGENIDMFKVQQTGTTQNYFAVVYNNTTIANAGNGLAGTNTLQLGSTSNGVGIYTAVHRVLLLSTNFGGDLPCWLQNSAARSRVASNVTNVTITPANITGLSSPLFAGRKYFGELVLYCSEATAGDGLRIDFDGGTATMTSFIAQGTLSDDTSLRQIARTTALATDITEGTITGNTLVRITFSLVCNAAGTFIPRAAKNTDAAGATITVTLGSFLTIEDCP